MTSQPNKYRWRQFSMRSLVIVMTLVCAVVAFRRSYVTPYQQQLGAIKALQDMRAQIVAEPGRPAWIRPFVGDGEFREIVEVKLEHYYGIGDAKLAALRELPFLRRLYLAGCSSFTDKGLEHIRGLKNLERVSLWRTKITDEGMKHLAGMQQLNVLDVHLTEVTWRGLAHLSKQRLEFLKTAPLCLGREGTKVLGSFHRLKQLDLSHQNIGDESMVFLKEMQNLETLSLAGTRVTDKGLRELAVLGKLRRLNIEGTNTSHKYAEQLFPRLYSFSWESRESVNDRLFDTFSSQGLKLERNEQGKIIKLVYSPRRNSYFHNRIETLIWATDLEELTVLSYWWFHNYVYVLRNLTKLKHLKLNNMAIKDWHLQYLSQMTSLKTLELRATRITGSGFKLLLKAKNLEKINLQGTLAADDGVEILVQFPKLSELNLSTTQITDAGLMHLKRAKNLKRLDIKKCTQVTPEAIDDLQAALPECEIEASIYRRVGGKK